MVTRNRDFFVWGKGSRDLAPSGSSGAGGFGEISSRDAGKEADEIERPQNLGATASSSVGPGSWLMKHHAINRSFGAGTGPIGRCVTPGAAGPAQTGPRSGKCIAHRPDREERHDDGCGRAVLRAFRGALTPPASERIPTGKTHQSLALVGRVSWPTEARRPHRSMLPDGGATGRKGSTRTPRPWCGQQHPVPAKIHP